MADASGPFVLPDRWVHADAAPSWSQLSDAAIAFVGWRLDRWPTLERLHALDEVAREADGTALVLGFHTAHGPGFSPDRIRAGLLARGAWTPTGLLDPETETPVQPGEVLLVAGGEVLQTFGAGASLETIGERLVQAAEPGESGWRPRGAAPGPWPLAFPTDVAVGGSRIAVADTGHNRVVVARPGGEILHLVGDGVPGDRDGSLAEARFEAPRGVCWRGEELLVADTSNDAIRSVRPATGDVTTLAEAPEGSLPAGLACTEQGDVLLALAGHGCLARLADGELQPVGEPAPAESHPMDVVHDGGMLACDLQGSRLLRVEEDGAKGVLWEGKPLVEPSGLVAGDRITVADPGSGSLLELDTEEGTSQAIVGPSAGLEAPAAVDREAQRLVVADGGGHHLWRVGNGEAPTRVRLTESPLALAEHIRLDPIEIAPGGELELSIAYLQTGDVALPSEPQMASVRGPVRLLDSRGPEREEGRVRVELTASVAASGSLRIRWNLTGEPVGHEAAWDLPIVVRPGAEDRLRLALSTSPP